MFTVEPLTPARLPAFVASRNSLFTPVSEDYCRRVQTASADFPVNTYIGREGDEVVSWATFYTRRVQAGAPRSPALRLAQACAIGTLPQHQRKGLGKKVWLAAEKDLAARADGILVYTNEGGDGYGFYRSLGYLPLAFPSWLRLAPAAAPAAAEPVVPADLVLRTAPLAEARHAAAERGRVFAACYPGHVGHFADRPHSLDTWSGISFFHAEEFMGFVPQITWLEDAAGRWLAYAIWAGPMDKISWKKGAVELWEIAALPDFLAHPVGGREALRALLQPAVAAARGSASVHGWAVPGHAIFAHLLALGFEELPRSLCVLGKLFDPAPRFAEQLRAEAAFTGVIECVAAPGGRLDLRLDDVAVQIERDAVSRLIFGRTTAAAEHLHGLLSVRPSPRAPDVLPLLDRAFPAAPWAYFASEYI